jgi:hypothetical protein
MKTRHKIIIAVVAVAAVGASAFAGINLSNTTPKTTASIEEQLNSIYKDADYFNELAVQTYAGAETEPQADKKAAADSASVNVSVKTLTAADFQDFLKRLPETEVNTYYQVGLGEQENYIGVYGFSNKQLHDEKQMKLVVDALKTREKIKTSYFQVGASNLTGDKPDNVTVTLTAPENTVESTRETVDAYLTKSTNVLAVNQQSPTAASYVQTGAVFGEMDDFDKVVGFGLQFAEQVFTDTNQISVIGLGKEVNISYQTVEEGITTESLKKAADDINTGNAYGLTVNVNDPAAAE